ncbi:hypothetical protein K3G63_07845 [Hymenobacter sp. HSC-4F20]|uniref:hypothetical protein n=1 Tax=Hymenobacter sp. HSC-4F20 TaxID=2864135 RepID=UPI001C739D61|nr:hypothetical protein [Hymenobacter sp. HSC-4F20]MBX0290346.1 hypothetical protein [Hymenobacter sp. HSC-4F20]
MRHFTTYFQVLFLLLLLVLGAVNRRFRFHSAAAGARSMGNTLAPTFTPLQSQGLVYSTRQAQQ